LISLQGVCQSVAIPPRDKLPFLTSTKGSDLAANANADSCCTLLPLAEEAGSNLIASLSFEREQATHARTLDECMALG
jgi:hypothetical protein